MLSLLWQLCDIIGLIFFVANGQILKNNLTIWSHCSNHSAAAKIFIAFCGSWRSRVRKFRKVSVSGVFRIRFFLIRDVEPDQIGDQVVPERDLVRTVESLHVWLETWNKMPRFKNGPSRPLFCLLSVFSNNLQYKKLWISAGLKLGSSEYTVSTLTTWPQPRYKDSTLYNKEIIFC